MSTHLSAPFWEGCRAGQLRYQRCGECGSANFPPAEHCRGCLSPELAWRTGAGQGEIYSWTVVHRPVTAEFDAPYAPAVVTLDEGYQMLTNIVGVPADLLRIGLRVHAAFHAVAPGVTLPYFTGSG